MIVIKFFEIFLNVVIFKEATVIECISRLGSYLQVSSALSTHPAFICASLDLSLATCGFSRSHKAFPLPANTCETRWSLTPVYGKYIGNIIVITSGASHFKIEF